MKHTICVRPHIEDIILDDGYHWVSLLTSQYKEVDGENQPAVFLVPLSSSAMLGCQRCGCKGWPGSRHPKGPQTPKFPVVSHASQDLAHLRTFGSAIEYPEANSHKVYNDQCQLWISSA